MDNTARPSTAGAPLELLTAHARLSITAERAASVAVQVDQVMALIDQLDAIDLGEAPPATAFDARWE